MEFHSETSTIRNINLTTRIILILCGVLLTSIIFAFAVNFLGEAGIWVGLILSGLLVFCGFYYAEKNTYRRTIAWGMLGTIILIAVAFFVSLNLLTDSLSDL